jgi:hypothetical protein
MKYLRPGFDEHTIQANIETLVASGHTMQSAEEAARAYAAQAEAASRGVYEAPTSFIAPKNNIARMLTECLLEVLKTEHVAKNFHVKGRGRVLIVKGAPTAVERFRGEPFVNDDRAALDQLVLKPLGLSRSEVALSWVDSNLADADAYIANTKPDVVISMCKDFRFFEKLGAWNLPALEVLKSEPHRAVELARKLSAIRKRLDATSHRGHSHLNLVNKGVTPSDKSTIVTSIHKRAPSQQIVYGVVLDPYQVDAQNDWVPPSEIEKTAINYMMRSRSVGFQHVGALPDATVVESFVEQYPSEDDREKAHDNLPHRVYARKYGNDVVHSGAWVMGVKLSDRLWKLAEQGEIDAFSIEGTASRATIEKTAMPKVTFVELGEVKRVTGRTSTEAT